MTLDFLVGIAVSLPLAWIAARVGRVSRAGAAVGLLVGGASYAAFQLAGLGVLGVALLLTLSTSRIARASTAAEGDDDGARGSANILANCGIGMIGALAELSGLFPGGDIAALWFVTGIVAGASDTVASEIGRAFGGPPRAFPTWRRAAPGTPGAISMVGTMAGACAALLMAAPAFALWLLPWRWALPVVIGCTAGSLLESALATALERRGLIGNHALNLLNTAAAVLCVLAWRWAAPAWA